MKIRFTHPNFSEKNLGGFTMVELLITIGIVAVLATMAMLVLNPAELLKQGRDERRVTDLEVINEAVAFTLSAGTGFYRGDANTVYVSVPDTSPTCDNLDLPALDSGWSYVCKTKADYQKTDGDGWIPIDFDSLETGSPLATLPIDPANSPDACLFYTYVPGWEMGVRMESSRYGYGGDGDVVGADGGDSVGLYETGTSLVLTPVGTCDFVVRVDEACQDNYILSQHLIENYVRWTPSPGSNKEVMITKLMFFQYDNSLSVGESVELAVYQDGAGENRLSEVVVASGTGVAGEWISGTLSIPVQINLGNTYVFGIGSGGGGTTYDLPIDQGGDCSGYPPSTSPGRYWTVASSGLNSTVPSGSDFHKYGFVGFEYTK